MIQAFSGDCKGVFGVSVFQSCIHTVSLITPFQLFCFDKISGFTLLKSVFNVFKLSCDTCGYLCCYSLCVILEMNSIAILAVSGKPIVAE